MSFATIIIGAVVAIAAYALGHYSGENRGKAIGWIERNDQEINRDAKRREQLNSRRDRDGTFQEEKR